MTGRDPQTGLIIEVAVGVTRPGQNLVTDRVLVRIDRCLPDRIVRLTGITNRDLASGGIPIDDALEWFVERTARLPLGGHNVIQSDRPYLMEAAQCHRQAVGEGSYPRLVINESDLRAERFIDIAGLYKGYLLGEYPQVGESHHDYANQVNGLKGYGLRTGVTAACEDLGVPASRIRANRAFGDVLRMPDAVREAPGTEPARIGHSMNPDQAGSPGGVAEELPHQHGQAYSGKRQNVARWSRCVNPGPAANGHGIVVPAPSDKEMIQEGPLRMALLGRRLSHAQPAFSVTRANTARPVAYRYDNVY